MNNTLRNGDFKRALKDRHVQLIALGGIIGSGYFLGTGAIVGQVGPAACLAYILGGLIIYLTMLCMGELAVAFPISGSFINYTADFISPTLACGVGWSYWICWVVYIPAECIAGGIIMQHFTSVNSYVWAILIGLVITYINLAKVGTFGEIEFWLALVKIIALIIFTIAAAFIFLGWISPESTGFIGGKYLYKQGGFFPNGKMALLTAMVLLLVNYQGSEIIGLAAGETINPGKTIPKAIRNVTYRILFIYIVPVFFLVLIFPWDKARLSNSVFAEALNFYGLHKAGMLASLVTLTAAISCANSGVYGIVRSLHTLSCQGMAPQYLSKLNDNAVPRSAGLTTLMSIWFVLSASYFFSKSQLYIALLLVSGFTGTIVWISLCWSQINFRKRLYKTGYTVADLKYYTPGSPYTGTIAILLMMFCLLFLLYNQDPIYKLSSLLGLISFIIPMIIYRLGGFNKKYLQISQGNQDINFDKTFNSVSSNNKLKIGHEDLI